MNWQPPRYGVPEIERALEFGADLAKPVNLATVEEALQVAKEVCLSCCVMTKMFQAVGFDIVFDYSFLKKRIKHHVDIDWRQHCTPVVQKKFKGVVPSETIATAAAVCARYFEEQDRDVQIWGTMQQGKSLLFSVLFLLFPILEKLINSQQVIPIINTPDKKNLSASVLKEMTILSDLYKDVMVRFRGQDGVAPSLGRYVLDYWDRYLEGKKSCNGFGTFVMQRNNSKEQDYYFLNDFRSKDGERYITLDFTDEIHHGSAQKSVMSKWNKRLQGCQYRRIGISATPSETWGSYRYIVVPMFYGPAFHGITRYNAEQLPSLNNQEASKPQLLAIEDVFPRFDLSFAANRGKVLCNVQAWYDTLPDCRIPWNVLTATQQKKYILRHASYKQAWALSVYEMYCNLVSEEQPIMFLRPFLLKEPCAELYDLLLKVKKGNYEILRYYGTLDDVFGQGQGSTRTIKEVLLDEYVALGKKCLVIAAGGRSRMGDSYPAECGVYMTFGEGQIDSDSMKGSDWNAVLQSTYGRSQGNGKKSTVYMPRTDAKQLARFIENGCYSSKSMSKRDDRRDERLDSGGKIRRGAPPKQRVLHLVDCERPHNDGGLNFYLPNTHGIGKEIFQSLCYNLNHEAYRRVEGGIRVGNGMEPSEGCNHFYEKAINRSVLDRLQEVTGDHYPNWGLSDQVNDKGMRISYGQLENGQWSPVGLRTVEQDEYVDAGGHRVRNEEEDITVRTQRKKGSVQIWMPQIVMTIRPLEVLQEIKMDSRYSCVSGGRSAFWVCKKCGNREKYGPLEIKIYPKGKPCCQCRRPMESPTGRRILREALDYMKKRRALFVPLRIHLPLVHCSELIRGSRGEVLSQNLMPNSKSMFNKNNLPPCDSDGKMMDRYKQDVIVELIQKAYREPSLYRP